jgi:hypothetical protein
MTASRSLAKLLAFTFDLTLAWMIFCIVYPCATEAGRTHDAK